MSYYYKLDIKSVITSENDWSKVSGFKCTVTHHGENVTGLSNKFRVYDEDSGLIVANSAHWNSEEQMWIVNYMFSIPREDHVLTRIHDILRWRFSNRVELYFFKNVTEGETVFVSKIIKDVGDYDIFMGMPDIDEFENIEADAIIKAKRWKPKTHTSKLDYQDAKLYLTHFPGEEIKVRALIRDVFYREFDGHIEASIKGKLE